MAEVREVKPVKLFIGMLARDARAFDAAVEYCAGEFGEEQNRSEVLAFDYTGYYTEEMGEDLLRQFVVFRPLIDPAELPAIKLRTNDMEKEFAASGDWDVQRPLNLDPGYVSSSVVVLASAKNHTHRLYLGSGIYGEVTLYFHKGTFTAWPWTYPDYQTGPYVNFFNEMRSRAIQQLRNEPD